MDPALKRFRKGNERKATPRFLESMRNGTDHRMRSATVRSSPERSLRNSYRQPRVASAEIALQDLACGLLSLAPLNEALLLVLVGLRQAHLFQQLVFLDLAMLAHIHDRRCSAFRLLEQGGLTLRTLCSFCCRLALRRAQKLRL